MKVVSSIFVISILFSMLYGQWPGEIQVTNTPVIERMYPNNWSVAVGNNLDTHREMVHIVWQGQITYSRYEVYYTQIHGMTPPRALTNNPNGAAFNPSIAASCLNVHIAYAVAGTNQDRGSIYYIRSTDGGNTWSTIPFPICTSGWAEYPSIAVSGNVVHVVWSDNPNAGGWNWEVYYRRSTDNGTTWTDVVKRLTNITDSGKQANFPCVAVFNNNVHVVWHSDSIGSQYGWEIYYKHSLDNGASWNTPTIRISESEDYPRKSREPLIAARGNNVYVAWTDERNAGSNAEVYFDCSYDNGNNWQHLQDLQLSTNDLYPSQHPCVAANPDFVFVVYQDYKNTNPVHNELWCTRSDDYGYSWTEEQVTANSKSSQTPAIATGLITAHIAWDELQDPYNPIPTNYDIYYNKKTFIFPLNNIGSPDVPLMAKQLSTASIHLIAKLQDASPVTMRLFNSLGQLVKKTIQTRSIPEISFIWQIGDLPKGVYFLQLYQKNGWQKCTPVVIIK